RLGVAARLGPAGGPVRRGDLRGLLDAPRGGGALVGRPPLLGDPEVLVRSLPVLQRLRELEQRRPQPPVEHRPVEELQPPFQPPQPEEQVAERPDQEEADEPVGTDQPALPEPPPARYRPRAAKYQATT